MSSPIRLERVEADLCRLELPTPVRLGRIVYRTRDYVVVRITRSDGVTGRAIGYTRQTPVLESLRVICESAADMDADRPEAVHEGIRRHFLPGWPALLRAASLLDIALWDAHARARSQPLHRLLGADTDSVPFMTVAGYFSDVRSRRELVEEALEFAEAGSMTMKLILTGADEASDRDLADAMAAALPSDVPLAIDFHAHFTDASSAATYCRTLADLAPRFIEDPFVGNEWRLYAELGADLSLPLATGEDAIGMSAFQDVLPHIDFLRLDATASGGISTALKAIDAAAAAGVHVVPHVFPYVHSVLCASFPQVANIETIPASVGADPMNKLLRSTYPVRDGLWWLTDEPGITLDLSPQAVRNASVATVGLDLRR